MNYSKQEARKFFKLLSKLKNIAESRTKVKSKQYNSK